MVSIIIFQGYFKVSLHLWWGGNSYKKSKMLIFSLWGGNQGFLSHWGCWWRNITIFSCQSFFLGTLGKNSRASCNKGVYGFLGQFSFFAGSTWFLADWLVLTWKASFNNYFGRFALCSPEIMNAKKLSFAWSGILMSESFEGRFRRDVNLNVYF